jgi:hypothetical protein
MTKRKTERLPDIDEVISTINHSTLPVVFIEGKDDAIVFRDLESRFSDECLTIFPLGGRDRVLQLYENRHRINKGVRFCFIADLDTWVMTGVPTSFIDSLLIFTVGYSIENDIYVDGNLETLLSPHENLRFIDELKTFLEWYALALSRHLSNQIHAIQTHPKQILECDEFRSAQMLLKEGEAYPCKIFDNLQGDYKCLLRGKSLLSLLFRQLCYPSRPVAHRKDAVIELIAKRNGPLISRFHEKVGTVLGMTQSATLNT